MSSIYKHLSKADLKLEREKPVLIPGEDLRILPPARTSGIKIAIVASFIFSVAAFSLAGYLIRSLAHEKTERRAIETAYAEFGKEAQLIKSESNQYRDDLKRMGEQLKNYSAERDNLQKELNRSRIEISNLEKKMKALEDSNKAMEKRARELQDEIMLRSRAPQVAASAEPEVQTAGIPLPASPGAAVSEAAVTPEVIAVAAPVVSQKQVMTVNRKFNFIVVNMGLRDGLTIGERLYVEKDGRVGATVEVEKLYDNFSAATIVDEVKDFKIAEGDLVRKA